MSVQVEVDGVDRLKVALDAMVARIDDATPKAVNEALRTVSRQQRTLLNLGSHPPGTRTGSPPGSPPWRITGHLMDSVTVRRAVTAGAHRWTGEMGPTAVYGRIQELGGWTGAGHRTHLPPRPSLYPAWRIVQPTLRGTFKDRWAAAIEP